MGFKEKTRFYVVAQDYTNFCFHKKPIKFIGSSAVRQVRIYDDVNDNDDDERMLVFFQVKV